MSAVDKAVAMKDNYPGNTYRKYHISSFFEKKFQMNKHMFAWQVWFFQEPYVSSILPSFGPKSGRSIVTIKGGYFGSGKPVVEGSIDNLGKLFFKCWKYT